MQALESGNLIAWPWSRTPRSFPRRTSAVVISALGHTGGSNLPTRRIGTAGPDLHFAQLTTTMKQLAALLAFLPLGLFAQTTWQVEAGGSTAGSTLPYYLPANITIAAGDLVHWTGVSGTHNVYGMLDVFPNNPEGFTSGQPVSGLNYTHAFTVAGVYQYHCTMQGHAATQFGSITVTPSTSGIASQTAAAPFTLFPQPAQNELTLELGVAAYDRAEVLNAAGAVVRSLAVEGNDRPVMDLSGLASGTYMLRLRDAQGHMATQPFVKQ